MGYRFAFCIHILHILHSVRTGNKCYNHTRLQIYIRILVDMMYWSNACELPLEGKTAVHESAQDSRSNRLSGVSEHV